MRARIWDLRAQPLAKIAALAWQRPRAVAAHGRPRTTECRLHRVQVSTDIAADPARVFELIGDPRKPFITVNPMVRLTIVSAVSRGVGTIYRWSFGLPWGGSRIGFDEEVTEWIEGQRFAYRAISGWAMRASTELGPVPAGTHVIFSLEYRLPWPWGLLVPHWLEVLGARRALANMKRIAEYAGDAAHGA